MKRSVPPFGSGEPQDQGVFGGHGVKPEHGGAAGQEDYADHAEHASKGISRGQRHHEAARAQPPGSAQEAENPVRKFRGCDR